MLRRPSLFFFIDWRPGGGGRLGFGEEAAHTGAMIRQDPAKNARFWVRD